MCEPTVALRFPSLNNLQRGPRRPAKTIAKLFRTALLAGILCASLPRTFAQKIPFVLPWNDSTPSVTDFSGLNRPIGTNRVVVDAEGHFSAAGERVRFLGVNFAGDSPFMPTNKAEAVAARLAKFGVNNVRFHHMDASWATGGGLLAYNSASSTNMNPAQLERLHYVVARLKAHGIYANINLLVGREYRPGDGLGPEVMGLDWKDAHVLGFFYPPALALHKDFATKLLTPTNRFTGLSLARDPAVSFVEIINENGVLQKWTDGGLDKLPQRYATNLQAQWNQWLATRYANDEALRASWRIIDQPLGTNLLRNGNFSNSLTSWNGEQHETAKAAFSRTYDFTNSQPSARIIVTTPDSTSWHIQFNQANLRMVSTQVYTLSFWAKSSVPTNIDVSIMRAHTDYAGLGLSQGIALTTNWQQFTAAFMPSATETNARVNFGSMGNKAATFWFADVRLQAGGRLGTLPGGVTLAGRNIPNIQHGAVGYNGTREARRDWVGFLRDLENAYYDQMIAHVRDRCGYTGLIFGTILANSPATVQNRMDVIDAHSYWQHPEFPGRAWDGNNWFVRNISMLNTFDNSLTSLARQRIHGKPFTVTEYQHSSPNYYGAEGPLLISAYGALQDWDGIWLFDYGAGQDSVPMGYVRGYFEIGQHPTKMANLLLAANIFRRGDVRQATVEKTLLMSPDKELDLLVNSSAWSIFGAGQLGMPGKLTYVNRISTTLTTTNTPSPAPPPNPTTNVVVSDTGELAWNLSQPSKGRLTINSSKTRAVLGFTDGSSFDLGGFVFEPGQTVLGWSTIGLTLKSGTSMTNSATLLLVTTGWWENTGQVWTDSTKQSVGSQWGRAPVLVEAVPFKLTIPAPASSVRVWALDTRGVRAQELPVVATPDNKTWLSIGTNTQTQFYEVEIGNWIASSFDSWRSRYFTQDELAQAHVSGPAATPDGDDVPNLLKYYYGLPGRTPAAPHRLPKGMVLVVGGENYLVMEYLRAKEARDVQAQAQIATVLPQWLPASCCTSERVYDLGALERVVVRDLAPVSANQSRFMRLAVNLAP